MDVRFVFLKYTLYDITISMIRIAQKYNQNFKLELISLMSAINNISHEYIYWIKITAIQLKMQEIFLYINANLNNFDLGK